MATEISYCVDGRDKEGPVFVEFDNLDQAEEYARTMCRKSRTSFYLVRRENYHPQVIARVSQDNSGRVWTDAWQMEGSLL